MDRKIEKKKRAWFKKFWFWLLILAAGLALGVAYEYPNLQQSTLQVERERLTISSVREGIFQEYIPVSGTVVPIKTVYLDAIEGGQVEAVYYEAGSVVQAGEPLLKLANTDLLLDVMNREAEVLQQQNNVNNARLIIEQTRHEFTTTLLDLDHQTARAKRASESEERLLNEELIAANQYEETKATYTFLIQKKESLIETHEQEIALREQQLEQAEAALQNMKANLNVIKQKSQNLVIEAPVSGQLTALNADIGAAVTQGERLGQIDVLDGFQIRIQIDEHYLARVDVGQQGEYAIAGVRGPLLVTKLYPEVVENRFEVEARFEGEAPGNIRRGQTLQIRLELGSTASAMLLSRGGFFQSTGGQWAYVLDEAANTAVKRPIKLGRQNPEVFEVLEGLTVGDKVIISSYEGYGTGIARLEL